MTFNIYGLKTSPYKIYLSFISLTGLFVSVISKQKTLIRLLNERGSLETAKYIYDWTAKKFFATKYIEFVWLDQDRAVAPEVKGKYEFRFLDIETLQTFLADKTNDLENHFISRVASGKHFCYAALDDGKLAAYSWYALGDVLPQDCFGFAMTLPSDVAYMYKGFTHPDYRGKRLHGYLMVHGLLGLNSHGVKYLISTIDWLNTASIKSSERIGYLRLGHGACWKFLGKIRHLYPRAVLAKGIQF